MPRTVSFRLRVFIILFSTLCISAQCVGQVGRSFSYTSGKLFPESQPWLLFEDAPRIGSEKFANLASSLAQELRARIRASYGLLSDNPLCSVVDRLFEPANLMSFRLIDINHDGFSDVVYSGSAQCTEGDLTITWFGSESGYTVANGFIWPVLLVRISLSSDQITSVKTGCCDDLKDVFFWGDISNFRRFGEISLLRSTLLPKDAFAERKIVKIDRRISIRSSPKIVNSYEKERSETLGHAVLGNIVRTYLPGSKAYVLYRTTIKDRTWYFVVMSDESERLIIEDPYRGVNVGWVSLPY